MAASAPTATTRVRGASAFTGSDYALLLSMAAAGFAGAGVWLSGQLAGLVFRQTWPDAPYEQAFTITAALPAHWADPRMAWPAAAQQQLPGPVAFYGTATVVFGLAAVALTIGYRRWKTGRPQHGMATRRQLEKRFSNSAVLATARRVRPDLAGKPTAADVAVDLGTAHGMRLYVGLETSVLLLAAPRQGKTSQVIIPWLRSFPGAAVVTSVRPDVLQATATLRGGTSWLMELTGNLTWPHRLTWTPIAGAEDYDIALQRADTMIQVGKGESSDSSNAGFFGMTATNLLAAWLHTAAVTGRTMLDVLDWSVDPTDDTPVKLLRDADGARPGVVKLLDSFYRQPDTTRSNLWTTVQTGTSCLFGTAAATVFGGPAAESFDIKAFLRSGTDTLYLLVDEKKAANLAPLVTTFVGEIITTAKALAERSEAGRLDPPLGLILDELANVVPLPDLPEVMSYAAGSGMFAVGVLQSLAAAEHRWGPSGRRMLWAHATVKIALGGLAGNDLDDISQLAGSYRETLLVPQRSGERHTVQASVVDRKTLPPERIRTLDPDKREALVIHATTPPFITRMQRHYESDHAADYTRAVRAARTLMGLPTKDDTP
jgi:type IV secretion system protein VirD4